MKISRTVPVSLDPELPQTRLTRSGILGRLKKMTKERTIADADAIAQRFRKEDRQAIRRFAGSSTPHMEFAERFSLLAYLMATKRIPADLRQAAEDALVSGVALPKIAGIAGVPMWTRLIPPASCLDPLGRLPASADFSCRISDVLRRRVEDDGDLRGWLRAVARANEAAGEEFALWLACRYPDGTSGDLLASPLRHLILWYLVSKAEAGLARDLIHTRWRRDLSLETAVRAARNFARRIDLELSIGPRGLDDPWYPRSHVLDFDFIPLTTSIQIREEAWRNENCLDTYSQRLVRNEARVYSVRDRSGQCVANVEIQASETHPLLPRIVQIKAPRNDPALPHLSNAADIWLQEQVNRHGAPDMRRRQPRAPDARRWDEIMASLKAAGTLPGWASACPTNDDLERTELEFSILGYRLHARGWRFA